MAGSIGSCQLFLVPFQDTALFTKMEFWVTPASRPSVSEENERKLTELLEAERQLVIETQENYKLLKERFLEVTEQLALSTKELEILRCEKEAEENARQELLMLDQKSRKVLRQMEMDNKQRQLAQHQFQTGTLAELQKVFRKELADQEGEIKKLEEEKEGLVEENDRLLEEVRQLEGEIAKARRVFKERERELADDFDRQLQEMMTSLEEEKKNRTEDLSAASLRTRIKMLEEMAEEKETERRRQVERLEEKRAELTENLVAEREKSQRLASYQSQVEMTKLEAKRIVQAKNEELDGLRKQIVELRARKISDDTAAAEMERRLRNEFFEQTFSFDEKLSEMELSIRERDQHIEELKGKLDETRIEENSVDQLEQNCQAEKESRERIEKENKKLAELVEKRDIECAQEMAQLKLERNRLEEVIAELKNRLKTTPETVEETFRLRAQLVKREDQERALKEHYRGLLSRMKTSLKNIEKRHRHTQRKLEEHILI